MSGTLGNVGTIGPQVIPFQQIPLPPYNTPGTYVEVQPSYAQTGILPWPARALITGQMLAAGSATAGKIYNITRLQQATSLFGAGSQLEAMVRAYFAANNGLIPVDVVAVADAAGATKAAGSFTISGTWTSAGTLALYVHGVYVPVPVAATDVAATVATNAAAAINDYANTALGITALQVTATATTNVVTVTARHGGLIGNSIDLWYDLNPGDALPAGMSVAIVAMTGGATNPLISSVITAITGTWYTDIAMPWQDTANLGALVTELGNRYAAMEHLDAQAYGVVTGTYSQQLAAQTPVNCPQLCLLGIINPPSTPWEIAASLTGVAAYNLTNDPSRQLRGLVLPGITGSRPQDRLIAQEKELELEGGICTFDTTTSGQVVLTRVVTTYLTNSQGVSDPSWHDVMTPKTMSRIRYDWRNYVSLLYPRNKLAPDGSIAAQYDPSVVTPTRMRGTWAARESLYEQSGWLVNGPTLNPQAVFQINANDPNRLDCSIPVQVIGNLIVLATLLQFQAA